MVEGIDRQGILAEEFIQHTPLLHADPVPGAARVLNRRVHLRGNVLVQRAAQDDVHQLLAAADGHDGLFRGQGRPHQHQVADVAERVDLHRLVPDRLAIVGRVQVRAAGEDDRVHPADQLRRQDGIRHRREDDRDAPGPGDGLGIVRRQGGGAGRRAAAGNADERLRRPAGPQRGDGKEEEDDALHNHKNKKKTRNDTAVIPSFSRESPVPYFK